MTKNIIKKKDSIKKNTEVFQSTTKRKVVLKIKNNNSKNSKKNKIKNISKKVNIAKKNISSPKNKNKITQKKSSKTRDLNKSIRTTINKKLIKIKLSKQNQKSTKTKITLIDWSKINQEHELDLSNSKDYKKNQDLIKKTQYQNLFEKLKNQNQLSPIEQLQADLNDCKFYHIKKRTNKYIAKRRLKNLYNLNRDISLFKKIKTESLKKINDKNNFH
jgi:hypothetical protein